MASILMLIILAEILMKYRWHVYVGTMEYVFYGRCVFYDPFFIGVTRCLYRQFFVGKNDAMTSSDLG